MRETYAMLSLPLCDVVYSHPLFPSSFGPPPAQRAAPPRWDDRPTTWREGTQVALGPVAVSTPYRRAELGIVLGPAAADTTVGSLDDLENLRIGIAQGTLGGVLLETQLPARLRAGAQLFAPGPGFLWQMEAGAFDATLVDTTAYDFHRRQNPITSLTLGEYRHPLGFNMGIAYLAGNAGLGAFLNGELAALLRVGTVAAMAEVSGTTYAPPVKPDVAQPLSLATLLSTR